MKFKNLRTGIIENVSLPELFKQYLDNPAIWEKLEEKPEAKPEPKEIFKKNKKGK